MQRRTLRDIVIPVLQQQFPDRPFVVGVNGQVATFAAAHPGFGELVIFDDGDEVTVCVGRLTHTHFGPVKDVSVTADVEMTIIEPLIEFLKDLFADRLLVWCVPGKCGGYQWVDDHARDIPKEAMMFLWSGPWRTPDPDAPQ